MSDTLTCGHPARFRYRHPSVGYGCIACHQTPIAIRRYAGELCGVDVTESDPIDFAKAIVDDPDSPLPRLVFADWLDEQGDPRGELIRVEAELAEMGVEARETSDGKLLAWAVNPPYCFDSDGIEKAQQLINRRTALRRQLGYDQPAEPFVKQSLTTHPASR